MKVLDMGCGPGFFSVEMAKLVGEEGKVYAADLQEGMLKKVEAKIKDTLLEDRITIIKCDADVIPVSEKVDFILAFYMVHEVVDKEKFFEQLRDILNDTGQMLIVEPKFHVKEDAFEQTLKKAMDVGFEIQKGPKLPFSFSSVLKIYER